MSDLTVCYSFEITFLRNEATMYHENKVPFCNNKPRVGSRRIYLCWCWFFSIDAIDNRRVHVGIQTQQHIVLDKVPWTNTVHRTWNWVCRKREETQLTTTIYTRGSINQSALCYIVGRISNILIPLSSSLYRLFKMGNFLLISQHLLFYLLRHLLSMVNYRWSLGIDFSLAVLFF